MYAAALSYLGITMASWQKFPFMHYYIEPAFVPTDKVGGGGGWLA